MALVRRHCRHHHSPTSAMQPAGQDPEGAWRARDDHSTALFADECQSFLDNVIARFGRHGHGMIPTALVLGLRAERADPFPPARTSDALTRRRRELPRNAWTHRISWQFPSPP